MKPSMPDNLETTFFSLSILLLLTLLKELPFQLCKQSLQAPWFITVAKANKATGLFGREVTGQGCVAISLNFNFILNRVYALGSHI